MKKQTKKKKSDKKNTKDLRFPHNAHYSMIYPDSEKRNDKNVTTGNES